MTPTPRGRAPRSAPTTRAPDSAAEIDAALDQAVLRWQITAALARLSPEHREVIRLAHYGGLTMREIAVQTGVRSAP